MRLNRSEYAANLDLAKKPRVVPGRIKRRTGKGKKCLGWLTDLIVVPVVYVLVRLARFILGSYL